MHYYKIYCSNAYGSKTYYYQSHREFKVEDGHTILPTDLMKEISDNFYSIDKIEEVDYETWVLPQEKEGRELY